MRNTLTLIALLLTPSLTFAEDGPMCAAEELATGETYGQCIGVPPICMYPDRPMCVCQGLQVSCTWVCGH